MTVSQSGKFHSQKVIHTYITIFINKEKLGHRPTHVKAWISFHPEKKSRTDISLLQLIVLQGLKYFIQQNFMLSFTQALNVFKGQCGPFFCQQCYVQLTFWDSLCSSRLWYQTNVTWPAKPHMPSMTLTPLSIITSPYYNNAGATDPSHLGPSFACIEQSRLLHSATDQEREIPRFECREQLPKFALGDFASIDNGACSTFN